MSTRTVRDLAAVPDSGCVVGKPEAIQMSEMSPSRTLARSGLRGSAPDRSCGQVDAPLESGPIGPTGQCHALGGGIEPDFLGDCPWAHRRVPQGIREARLGLAVSPGALGPFHHRRADGDHSYGLADGRPVAGMVLGRRQVVFPAPDSDGVHDLLGIPSILAQIEGESAFVFRRAIPAALKLEPVSTVHGPGGREFRLPLAKLLGLQYLPGVQLRRWVQPETSTLPTL